MCYVVATHEENGTERKGTNEKDKHHLTMWYTCEGELWINHFTGDQAIMGDNLAQQIHTQHNAAEEAKQFITKLVQTIPQ